MAKSRWWCKLEGERLQGRQGCNDAWEATLIWLLRCSCKVGRGAALFVMPCIE